MVVRICFHPFKSTQCLQVKIQTTHHPLSHSQPFLSAFHPTLQAFHWEISNLPLRFAQAHLSAWNISNPVSFLTPSLCLAHTPHPQAESPSLSFLASHLSNHLTHYILQLLLMYLSSLPSWERLVSRYDILFLFRSSVHKRIPSTW